MESNEEITEKKVPLEETLNYYHSKDWKEYEYYLPDIVMEFNFLYEDKQASSVFYLQEFVEDKI